MNDVSLFAPAVAACDVCGPLEPPLVHRLCHADALHRNGCGHPLDEHTSMLTCRTCGTECGLDCAPARL